MRISGMDASFKNAAANGPAVRNATAEAAAVSSANNENESVSLQKNADKTGCPINEKFVSEAVERVNKMFEGSYRKFEYSVHEKTNDIIIRVIDETTNEVIREIPPEKILDMVASMMELAGLIVDERR